MFEKTRAIMNRHELYIKNDNNLSYEERCREAGYLTEGYVFDMAKAMCEEIPSIYKIAKMICVMDDSLKVQIEVK